MAGISKDFPKLPDGVLVVNKPPGMTSKDVSRFIERRVGKLKMGHAGTLDPMAEGVLPILIGKATRLQDFLHTAEKSYEFDLEFGYETDSLDADGEVISRELIDLGEVDEEAMRVGLSNLVGRWCQTPPIYSAVKYLGRPLYAYARAGKADEVPLESLARPIEVFGFEVKAVSGRKATLAVRCSKGTYVRGLGQSIAHKMGRLATITRLVRTRSSGFCLDQAVSLEMIENSITNLSSLVLPLKDIPLNVPKWQVSSQEVASKLWMGLKVPVQSNFVASAKVEKTFDVVDNADSILLLLDEVGEIFGIGEYRRVVSGESLVSLKRGLR